MLDKVDLCKCPIWYNETSSKMLSLPKAKKESLEVLENESFTFALHWSGSIKHHMPVTNGVRCCKLCQGVIKSHRLIQEVKKLVMHNKVTEED